MSRRRCCCDVEPDTGITVPNCCTSGKLNTTLTLTDALGSITLTHNQVCAPGAYTWSGGRTISGRAVRTAVPGCFGYSDITDTLGVAYSFSCTNVAPVGWRWVVSRVYYYIFTGGIQYYAYSDYINSGSYLGCLRWLGPGCTSPTGALTSYTNLSPAGCDPLNLTAAMATGGGVSTDPIGGSVTITE